MTNILDALKWRYAVKKFDTKIIPQEKVNTILESLILTPSSLGLQAWKFILVKNPETRLKLLAPSMNQRQVIDASHLLVLARKTSLTHEDIEKWTDYLAQKRKMTEERKIGFTNMIKSYVDTLSEEKMGIWLDKQLYIALGNLMTVCALEEIDACPMEGFNPKQYDEVLQLESKGLKSVIVCPIGYRAHDDIYQELPKVRFPKSEMILEI